MYNFITPGIGGNSIDWGYLGVSKETNTIGDYLERRNCNLYKCKFYIDEYLGEELYSDNHHFKCSYCEICEHYYNEVHHFAYCDIIESDEDGHYVICNDCGYTEIRRR